ncbi:MAG: response regulator [Anaerolineae bacterium]|nr:response regulator [Anaerolineae bacterium]
MVEQVALKDSRKQKVLIVEDEELLAKAIAATLDLEGLHTIVAHDGDQALTFARNLCPDLILLDVMLPGRTGIEVCATLKTGADTASIPVILLTAKGEKDDRALGLAAGANAYVVKPFSPVQLIDLVKEVLAGEEPQYHKPSLATMSADQLLVYAQDLRELFQQERAERQVLEEARQQLDEMDQLKAEFVSSVTHELLTPFASIGLAMEVLQRQSEDSPPELKLALEDLMTQIAGLHRQVSGVVKFAELVGKKRDPQPGYISLDRVIPWAVQPVAVLAQSREVDFRALIPTDLPSVHADPELLGEAVFQMAHNAVKFNSPGGRAQVQVLEYAGGLMIKVTDTGIGLTPEQLVTLGQPFEQDADALRRGQEGLGIGWAFVCYVAEVHDGWTHVESPGPGQGSTFSLVLPLPTEQHEFDAASEETVE